MKMKYLTQHPRSLGVLSLALVFAAATIPMSKPTQAQGSAPVTVVNTPLPVSLVGTGTISGSVNAAQSGVWNVGVTSLPAVQLAAGTTVGITGGLSNTAASPLFVRDVDEPGRNAYAVFVCQGTESPCEGVTVPAGKRYVIEQVAGECQVGTGSTIYGFRLHASLNGVENVYPVRNNISADSGGGQTTTGFFFQPARIYADGGTQLSVAFAGLGASAFCGVNLSGHLVPMP
jgi:hypothetical protein